MNDDEWVPTEVAHTLYGKPLAYWLDLEERVNRLEAERFTLIQDDLARSARIRILESAISRFVIDYWSKAAFDLSGEIELLRQLALGEQIEMQRFRGAST